MGFFNRKLSLEDILEAIEGLSEDEKAQVKAKMEELGETPEEPKEMPEEPQVDNMEEKGEGVEEMEQPEGVEETPSEVPENVPETDQLDGVEQDNKEDVLHGLGDRIQALEEKLAEFDELKALMEDFTKKQADSFGYKGAIPGVKKDIHDMSASELKQKMLNGEI
jgi:hypothetical protein